MPQGTHTITCLIGKKGGGYYTGDGWNAAVYCVIQDRHFDYFNGSDFVYDLSSAKLYAPHGAEAERASLNK